MAFKIMFQPLFKANQLGESIPDSQYAISVCMPLWQDVIDYEEGKSRVKEALKAGYPRFVFSSFTKQLIDLGEKHFNQKCLPFPSLQVAKRAQNFVLNNSKIEEFKNLPFLLFNESSFEKAFAYWRHTGEIVSARLAKDILNNTLNISNGQQVKDQIKKQISNLIIEKPQNIFLFATGMAAIFGAFRLLSSGSTVQIGFPYVDTFKIQQKFGSQKAHLIANIDDLEKLENILKNEKISGIFTEFPTNPLLQSVDLNKLSQITNRYKVPLIIDDTIGNFVNVQVLPPADILVSSLTKIFSGYGDVMAGSLVLNSQSFFYEQFKTALEKDYEDLLYIEDAKVIAKRSSDLETRVQKINFNAEKLYDYLSEHPKVKQIFYPKYQNHYKSQIRPQGGFGGLFSLVFENYKIAASFYDKLQINKGPSLGTNYSLACPYTLLAHYHELDFAAKCGVSASLVRVSVGLENIDDLIKIFEEALS